jgi:cytochrome c oxidase subunit 2
MADTDLTESVEEQGKQRWFFLRGALLGLVGGALVAVLLFSVFGSVASLADDMFGSGSSTAADEEQVPADPLVAQGQDLAQTQGCTACHTTNGIDMTGPSWKGVADTQTDDYIRQSILDPNADIVEGFQADLMPQDYAGKLSDEDLDALVAYIKSL